MSFNVNLVGLFNQPYTPPAEVDGEDDIEVAGENEPAEPESAGALPGQEEEEADRFFQEMDQRIRNLRILNVDDSLSPDHLEDQRDLG